MAQESDYGQFLKLYKEISTLGAANSILQWDMETKMPAKGINKRANQMSLLSVLAHQKFTNPALGSLINKIKASPDYNANAVMKRNIEVFEKVYTKVSKLPGEFVAELSKQRGLAVDAWKKAKAKRDYSMFKDHLKKNIELATRKAKYINPDAPVYDVLLDDFEPKMPEKTISPLFEELKSRLVPLVKKCVDSSDKPDISFINMKVLCLFKNSLGYKLTEFIGLDSQAFRLIQPNIPSQWADMATLG